MPNSSALGHHILSDFSGCAPDILNDVSQIESAMVAAALDAGATIDNTSFHHFSPYGVSGVVVIHESHLAIHTWPEYGFAAVDLFTCGTEMEPWAAHTSLKAALKASGDSTQEIERGDLSDLSKKDLPGLRAARQPRRTLPYSRNIWFTDRDDDIALSLRHGGCLFRKESPYQKVEVLDTTGYGKMLVLDDTVMCTERDEFVYHEMIAHVPVLAHPNPEKVLVIGGGDGGAARELLRHDEITSIVVVEIDETVVEASREHFPHLASAFDHSKVSLVIQDGIEYAQTCDDGEFDLIIVDSTDPKEIATGLFEKSFYADALRILKPGGVLATQSEPPALHTSTFRNIYDHQRAVFGADSVHCYLAFIPTYTTGMISFSFAAEDGRHPVNDLRPARAEAFTQRHHLHYYNLDIHRAAFALPGFVRELLGRSGG